MSSTIFASFLCRKRRQSCVFIPLVTPRVALLQDIRSIATSLTVWVVHSTWERAALLCAQAGLACVIPYVL
jgi:hypothetical protein